MFNQLLLNGIIAGSIYALIALGFTINYKTVRYFHFAHGVSDKIWRGERIMQTVGFSHEILEKGK
ncbi:MAG: hypothetical protein HZA13_07745 [Nitrospirae bacterium]|nr:hypothetical protein [Nitrospirota bacterium]